MSTQPEYSAAELAQQKLDNTKPKSGLTLAPNENHAGLSVVKVVPKSASYHAGIQAKDILLQFARRPMNAFEDFKAAWKPQRTGDRFPVVIRRRGVEIEKWMTVGCKELPFEEVVRLRGIIAASRPSEKRSFQRAPTVQITPAMVGDAKNKLATMRKKANMKFRHTDTDGGGLRVTELGENGCAAEAGLAKLDIIVEAFGKRMLTTSDFKVQWNKVKVGDSFPVVYLRKGQRLTTTMYAGAEGYTAQEIAEIRRVAAHRPGTGMSMDRNIFYGDSRQYSDTSFDPNESVVHVHEEDGKRITTTTTVFRHGDGNVLTPGHGATGRASNENSSGSHSDLMHRASRSQIDKRTSAGRFRGVEAVDRRPRVTREILDDAQRKVGAMVPKAGFKYKSSVAGQQPPGLFILAVNPKSPAAEAGLQDRDVITQIDGQELHTEATFFAWWKANAKPGQTVDCNVARYPKPVIPLPKGSAAAQLNLAATGPRTDLVVPLLIGARDYTTAEMSRLVALSQLRVGDLMPNHRHRRKVSALGGGETAFGDDVAVMMSHGTDFVLYDGAEAKEVTMYLRRDTTDALAKRVVVWNDRDTNVFMGQLHLENMSGVSVGKQGNGFDGHPRAITAPESHCMSIMGWHDNGKTADLHLEVDETALQKRAGDDPDWQAAINADRDGVREAWLYGISALLERQKGEARMYQEGEFKWSKTAHGREAHPTSIRGAAMPEDGQKGPRPPPQSSFMSPITPARNLSLAARLKQAELKSTSAVMARLAAHRDGKASVSYSADNGVATTHTTQSTRVVSGGNASVSSTHNTSGNVSVSTTNDDVGDNASNNAAVFSTTSHTAMQGGQSGITTTTTTTKKTTTTTTKKSSQAPGYGGSGMFMHEAVHRQQMTQQPIGATVQIIKLGNEPAAKQPASSSTTTMEYGASSTATDKEKLLAIYNSALSENAATSGTATTFAEEWAQSQQQQTRSMPMQDHVAVQSHAVVSDDDEEEEQPHATPDISLAQAATPGASADASPRIGATKPPSSTNSLYRDISGANVTTTTTTTTTTSTRSAVLQRQAAREQLASLDPELGAGFTETAAGHSGRKGLLITQVIAGLPADRAGVQVGDVLLAANGDICEDKQAFFRQWRTVKAGQTMDLTIQRGNNEPHTRALTVGGKGVSIDEIIRLQLLAYGSSSQSGATSSSRVSYRSAPQAETVGQQSQSGGPQDDDEEDEPSQSSSFHYQPFSPVHTGSMTVVQKLAHMMSLGREFTLYGEDGRSQRVRLHYRETGEALEPALYWGEATADGGFEQSALRAITLASITSVAIGKQTQRLKAAHSANEEKCFSLLVESQDGRVESSLDLEASDPQVKTAWVYAVMAVRQSVQGSKPQLFQAGTYGRPQEQYQADHLPYRKVWGVDTDAAANRGSAVASAQAEAEAAHLVRVGVDASLTEHLSSSQRSMPATDKQAVSSGASYDDEDDADVSIASSSANAALQAARLRAEQLTKERMQAARERAEQDAAAAKEALERQAAATQTTTTTTTTTTVERYSQVDATAGDVHRMSDEQLFAMLEEGSDFTWYCTKRGVTKGQRVQVFFNAPSTLVGSGSGSIHWCLPGDWRRTADIGAFTVPAGSITDVYLGKSTNALQSNEASNEDAALCVAIKHSGAADPLSFVATSAEQLSLWFAGMRCILSHYGRSHIVWVHPADGSAPQKMTLTSAFSLSKALAYTENALPERLEDIDGPCTAQEFTAMLADQWVHVDRDSSGHISYDELRAAVWCNQGRALSELRAGPLPPHMQEVVDDIVAGTGGKGYFDFWEFTNYMIKERELGSHINVQRPPHPSAYRDETWVSTHKMKEMSGFVQECAIM